MGTLDAVQQEQLQAIGTYLSQIRLEQNRSLEDIAAKTYIPLRLLKAIEAGQERPLPEPVFIQGFIRRYADALGLDGLDLAQRFPIQVTPLPVAPAVASESFSGRETRPRETRQRETRPRETRPQTIEPYVDSQPNEHSTRRQPRRSLMPYLAAAALLGLAGFGLGVVRALSSRQVDQSSQSSVVLPKQPNPTAESAPTQTVQPDQKAQAPVSTTSPSASSSTSGSSGTVKPVDPTSLSTASPTATTAKAPVSVSLKLTDRSWVQVMVDGEVKAESVLPKGTQQNWTGQQSITVVAGNAGAVSLAANGGAAKAMGTPGDVKELTVKPKPKP